MKDTLENVAGVNNVILVDDFILSQTMNGLCAHWYNNKSAKQWTRTTHSSQHLQIYINVSDIQSIKICIDDICSVPSKLGKYFRLALRNR